MALVGMSRLVEYNEQRAKIDALAEMEDRPDIVADLSILVSDRHTPLWRHIATHTPFLASALPIYFVQPRRGLIDSKELLETAIRQMEGGVALLTIHPTPSREL